MQQRYCLTQKNNFKQNNIKNSDLYNILYISKYRFLQKNKDRQTEL